MHRNARYLAALALLGCDPATSGPIPTGVPQTDGTSLPVPAECRVETGRAAPYQVTFRFRNARPDTVYIYDFCRIQYSISSCASGFRDDLAPNQSLPCSCDFAGQCPVGGPCGRAAGPIAPGAVEDVVWSGTREIQIHRDAYECTTTRVVPPGRYRVTLPLFASPATAQARAPLLTTATAEFTLPAAGDLVEVTTGP
jgi:hypothetical protein